MPHPQLIIIRTTVHLIPLSHRSCLNIVGQQPPKCLCTGCSLCVRCPHMYTWMLPCPPLSLWSKVTSMRPILNILFKMKTLAFPLSLTLLDFFPYTYRKLPFCFCLCICIFCGNVSTVRDTVVVSLIHQCIRECALHV